MAGRRTYDALLDAGVAVAEEHGLAGLSVNAAAQLLTAEIAIRELDAGRRLPAARRALRRYLGAR